jgi:hypothetical protein
VIRSAVLRIFLKTSINHEVNEDHEENQDLALPVQFTRRVRRRKPPFACFSSWPSCSSWFNCFFQDNMNVARP